MPGSEQGWRVSRGPLEDERNSWRPGDYLGAALKKVEWMLEIGWHPRDFHAQPQ